MKSLEQPSVSEWKCCRGPKQSTLCLVQEELEFTKAPLTASQLEQFIARRLAVECPNECNNNKSRNDDNEDEDDDDVVKFAMRYDAHWLNCQPSMPLFTVLGIYEDENDPHFPVQISYWKAQDTGQSSCSCQPPHSEWIRTERTTRTPISPSTPSLEYHIRCIDLRSLSDDNDGINVFTSPEQVWHCLGSLLGRHHLLNPWVPDPDESDDTSPPPQMVLLFLSTTCPALRDFRVSDACPSWFFHGYAYLDEWVPTGSPSSSSSSSPAVMYMYKRLKARIRLSVQHPLEDTTATIPPAGCLWETVPPQQTEETDHTKQQVVVGGGDEQQQQQQPPTYRIVSPPYLNLREEYGHDIAQGLFAPEALAIFQQEALAIPQWTPWPETQHYSLGSNGETTWTVFPLCYCFPAHDVSQRTWVTQTKHFCPQTCAILESVLGDTLRTALFSQLRPQTTLAAHTGWADLANAVLRLHIPLVVPTAASAAGLCGTWVDGCIETHQTGRPLLFDDSKIHRAFNYSNQSRIVLIVDLARPSSLPLGYATGGHSDELDQFIAQMSVPK